MHSPYLDRPLLPLAVVLSRMLEEIDVDLAIALLRGLLAPSQYADDDRMPMR